MDGLCQANIGIGRMALCNEAKT